MAFIKTLLLPPQVVFMEIKSMPQTDYSYDNCQYILCYNAIAHVKVSFLCFFLYQ